MAVQENIVRIVRGNDFITVHNVTAYDVITQEPIQDFDLSQAEEIKITAVRNNVSRCCVREYDILPDNDIKIYWDGKVMRSGTYSVEICGEWRGSSWRIYNVKENTFWVVEANELANYPNDMFVAEGTYYFETKIGFIFGAQANWAEDDPLEPDYIRNKPTIPDELKDLQDDATHRLVTDTEKSAWNGKQAALVSGTNIKTINNQSILGSGNINIEGGSGEENVIEIVKVNGTALTPDANKAVDVTVPTQLSQLNEDTTHRLVTDTEKSTWNSKGTYSKPSGGIPKTDLESSVQTSLGKADTALQSYTETDPTVPSWAKADSKPSYTASEVGAVPTTRTVNGKALSADITLSASDVNALPSSTVIPDAQIQSDWNQTTTTAKDYIKNKPTIPAAQVQANWNETSTSSKAYIQNKPTIPAAQVNSDWSASSGVAQILNKPTIPSALSQLTDDTTHRVVTDTEKAAWNGKADKTPIVNHTASETTVSIEPNVFHIWPQMSSLNITLATPTDNTIVNEYMIEFTSGSTATTLSLPASVEWGNRDPLTGQTEPLVVAADATYQISIINNIGLWTAIANS